MGKTNDINKLVEQNQGFVVTTARQYQGRGLDIDDLIEPFLSLDAFVFSGDRPRAVQVAEQCLRQHLVDKRRFSRARNTGHRRENFKRELHREVL